MSTFKIQGGVNSIGAFWVCEDEHFVITQCKSVLYISCRIFGLIYTPHIFQLPNQISIFVLMSTFTIYSGVNSGHNIGDFWVCEDEHFVFTQCKSILYNVISCSFYWSHLYTPHFLVVYIHNLGWCKQWIQYRLVTSGCVRMSVLCLPNVNRYCTCLILFGLIYTPHIFQLPNHFILMSTFIIQSGVVHRVLQHYDKTTAICNHVVTDTCDINFPKCSSMQFNTPIPYLLLHWFISQLSYLMFILHVNTGISSRAVEQPLVIKKINPAPIPAENIWEPPTEHVFCFAVLAARQGGVPEIKVSFTSTPA